MDTGPSALGASDPEVSTSLPPSHILQDGRHIHLPPPTTAERRRFFERSISRHGLLQSDLSDTKEENNDDEEKEDKTQPKVHPLAMASARLQADGINELNRAINLSTLVNTNEFFGLSNIVDPALEISKDAAAATSATAASGAAVAAAGAVVSTANLLDQKTKSLYILKRKRQQFDQASTILDRHQKRLKTAIVTQTLPDERFRRLRPTWRLVAPEHASKALPHATLPTEVIAADIDVYAHDRQALGRVARRVPRYATMEIKPDFDCTQHFNAWTQKYMSRDSMDESPDEASISKVWTRAEPYMIADSTLGKLDTDFNPQNVAMLTLQFLIVKDSTGFCQSANMEPIVRSLREKGSAMEEDELLLSQLQHSLFCAKLFECIRRELTPDTEDIGTVGTKTVSSAVWLSTSAEESFLPSPLQMAGITTKYTPLVVVHCHEGEVKVRLNAEYSLCVKLVETAKGGEDEEEPSPQEAGREDCGSQSPERLLALCRALLLHAQDAYHHHSLELARSLKDDGDKKEASKVLKHKIKTPEPRILQRTISLGAKLMLEGRLRQVLQDVKTWAIQHLQEPLHVEWLSLSVFDLHSHFTLTFADGAWDVTLDCDTMTVTSMNNGVPRKVNFQTDWELQGFLESTLRRWHRNDKQAK